MVKKSTKNIVAIVQARMGSRRLPGKVLMDIASQPMLAWVVERARLAKNIAHIGVATTDDPGDDPIVEFCEQQGYMVYRGSVFDVLDRYYHAAKTFKADVIVRLTADCPVIDPGVVDLVVTEFFDHQVDFAANRLPPPWKRTFPIGLDTEVCSFFALERAWCEAKLPHEREHVMPYLYDQPGRFHISQVNTYPDYGSLRWTVDTLEDLEFIRKVFSHLGEHGDFTWLDVLALVQSHPELSEINSGVTHKAFDEIDSRIRDGDGMTYL